MTHKPLTVWIGFDPREAAAFAVARESIRRFDRHLPVHGLVLSELRASGLYTRPTARRRGKLWDEISGAHMSTEFALSRFLVPELMRRQTRRGHAGGWAVFMDCDVMVRANPDHLRELLDDDMALMCVKHDHRPNGNIKMDEQVQTAYPRKNWSSVMALNCDHDANQALDVEMVNALPGLDLHRFCWLGDSDIGALPHEWNYLVGHTDGVVEPKLVHWTDGGPWFLHMQDVPYSSEWFSHLTRWAR